MKLEKKKMLAAKTLGVGEDRIVFNIHRLAEIKEAITKQDIRDLHANKAILIREIKGRRTHSVQAKRRRAGSVRKKVGTGKRTYVIMTRKLRAYTAQLRNQDKLTSDQHKAVRKDIRASKFRSKAHLKEHLATLDK